jgi:hypothetical protein
MALNVVNVIQLAAAGIRASDNDFTLGSFSGGGANPLVDKESANARRWRHCSARKLIPSKRLVFYNTTSQMIF